jgi:RHS repeat-associated protein
MQGAAATESYSYDPVGNRLSSLGLSPWNFNSSNQLLNTPAATFTYDNNGNMLSKAAAAGTTGYSWDLENRLSSVNLPAGGGTVSFAYDPFGRRIKKSTASGSTIYLYDGANVVAELNAAGAVVASYAQGAGIDEPLAMQRNGSVAYYHADGLGSITSLTGNTGQTVATYTYDSFGNTTPNEAIFNPYRYTAREQDPETGLYHYRARYYDPTAARFLSEDPIDFDGGINFYAYVGNNPLNWTDPWGTSALPLPPAQLPPPPGPVIVTGGAAAAEAGVGAAVTVGGLIVVDAGLAIWDYYQARKLCAAYGWAWCAAKSPNKDENRKFKEAVRRINKHCDITLTPQQERWLHDEITKKGYTIDEIVQIGIDWFCPGKKACEVPKKK